MLRPIAIALILVLSVGVMLPFANEAHGIRQTVQVGQRRHHRFRSRHGPVRAGDPAKERVTPLCGLKRKLIHGRGA